MNLVVDIGNTFSKLAVFDQSDLVKHQTCENVEKTVILDFIQDIDEKVKHVILSAVNLYPEELDGFFTGCFDTFIRLNHQTPLPFQNQYETPQSLGPDRIAAVAGALTLFPNENALVIDAGTCITYDIIDRESNYHGGAISPGLNMRFKAMHEQTGALPLIPSSPDPLTPLIGRNTENSMKTGVINGASYEIEGMINRYNEQFDELKVLITGGDAEVFEKVLKKSIFADPKLVLKGLNEILRFNIE